MGDMNDIVQVKISLYSENSPVVPCNGLRCPIGYLILAAKNTQSETLFEGVSGDCEHTGISG